MDSLKPVLRLVVDDHLAALAATEASVPDGEPRWELLEECRLDPDRPQTSKTGRQGDFRRSPTDPDGALMKPKGERACLGYQSHYIVDGGKARIILHTIITPGDVMENQPMLDQLRRVMFRWRVKPKRVIADTMYRTIDNIRAVEERRDTSVRASARQGAPAPLLRPAQFTYDAMQDAYVCPQGMLLHSVRREYKAEKVEYRAAAAICNACPMKAACTPSDQGRAVHRSLESMQVTCPPRTILRATARIIAGATPDLADKDDRATYLSRRYRL
jgi:hypothetical protein